MKTHASPRSSHTAFSTALLAFSLSAGVADLANAEPLAPAGSAAPATPAAQPPAAPAAAPATEPAAPVAPSSTEPESKAAATPSAPATEAPEAAAAPLESEAAENSTQSSSEAAGSGSPLPAESNGLHHLPARDVLAPLDWPELSGQGVSFGYESGLWGSRWEQGLRVGVPFSRHFAVHLRALYTSETSIDDDVPYTADLGGKVDVIGRSLPFFNVVRLYGGGGIQVFEPVVATEGRQTQIGGGGHFGFEFFCFPQYSFFLEVGGQGGKPSPGATVLAGMAFYPWTE